MAKVIEEGKNVKVKFKGSSETDYKDVGKVVRIMRDNRDVSQSTLSDKINRERTGLSNYECGKTVPTLYALHEISEVLDYDMEVTFKEALILNRDIITKEYVEKFMSEKYDKNSLTYNVLSRLEALDEEWYISKEAKNDITITFESGKTVRISVGCYNGSVDTTRFLDMFVQAVDESKGSFCNWFSNIDSKENGLGERQTKELIALINDCFWLGRLETLNKALDCRLEDRIDIDKLSIRMYESYSYLKMDYNLKDDDILEIVQELFERYEENFFTSLITSSRSYFKAFYKEKDEFIKKITDLCKQRNIKLSDEGIYNIFCIAYCVRFSVTAFNLYTEGSDYRDGSYICKFDIEQNNNAWGDYVIEPHVLKLIDDCFNELSSIYTKERCLDIIESLLLLKDANSVEYSYTEHYIELYKKQNGYL